MSVVIEQLQSAIKFVEKDASLSASSLKKAEIHTQPLQEIPRFYFQADLEDPLLQLVRKLAIEKRVERVEALLLTLSDLQLIWASLETNSRVLLPIDGRVISYADFKKISSELPDKTKWLFKPEVFMKLPKSNTGCISIQMLYSLITRAANLIESLFTLNNYSREFEGFLTEEELQEYLEDMLPHLNLKPQSVNLRKFYICTCIRKFTFFHDKMRQGKMSINSIVFSSTLSELHELRHHSDISADLTYTNWFSSEYTQRVYGDFIEMDTDRNGMLSRKELSRYRNGNLTKSFLDRIFLNVQLFNDEMDYLVYLDFVLAMENLDTPEGQAYVFKMLDVKNDGFLDESTIYFYVKDVIIRMFAAGMATVTRSDMVNEIFDMVNPVKREVITLSDIQKCGMGGVILNILVDFTWFQQYDSRSQQEGSG